MLDGADPVGDLGEVADAELLLLLHAEGAVVGADHAEVPSTQVAPQLVLVALRAGPQRGAAYPLRTLEPRCAELLLEGEVEVLGTRLAEDVVALVARLREGGDRLLRTHVHDVERGAGEAGQHDRAVGGLLLGLPRPGEPVVDRVGLATGQRLGDEDVDGHAVLGVHHDERAVLARRLHGPQDLAVVGVEDAGVGHEQLEAGDPVGDQLVHRLERVVVDAADDLVEPVVDRTVAGGLLVPRGESVLDALPGALDGEVDDRRRPAPRGRASCRSRRCPRRWSRRTAAPCGYGRRPRRGSRTCRSRRSPCRRCREVAAERGVAGSEERRDRLAVDQHVGLLTRPVGPTTVPPRDQDRGHRLGTRSS